MFLVSIFAILINSIIHDNNAIAETYTLNLKKDVNLISIPFKYSNINTAANLIDLIPGCNQVKYWDVFEQSFIEYNLDANDKNFSIIPGYPYAVRLESDIDYKVSGEVYAYPYFILMQTKTTNLNFVTLPFDKTDIKSAEQLANDIPNCDTIWCWNEENQAYLGHPVGSDINNFTVTPGNVYIINVTQNGIWHLDDTPP
ncbi:MAG: hypothetical protein OMM_15080, partial [Candidatus Magnetoglobus multicellularis str. Araruama]